MKLASAIFGCGPVAMLALSYYFDWICLKAFNTYAAANGMQQIGNNIFTAPSKLWKTKKNIPSDRFRKKITAFQLASIASVLGFVVIMLLSMKYQ